MESQRNFRCKKEENHSFYSYLYRNDYFQDLVKDMMDADLELMRKNPAA